MSTFDSCLYESQVHEEIVIDLADVTFVDPYALVGITYLAAQARAAGLCVLFRSPSDRQVANYLARMHLGGALEGCGVEGSGNLPTVSERPLEAVLLPLTEASSEWQFEQLAGLVYDRLRASIYPGSVNALYEALCELGANTIEHSEAGRGFVAAQTFLRGQPNEYVIAAVGDAGVGLRASLAPRHSPSDDLAAVDLALQEGISRFDDPGRGVGLSTLVETVVSLQGQAAVRSGRGLRRDPQRGLSRRSVPHIQGTLVAVRVPCQPGGTPL